MASQPQQEGAQLLVGVAAGASGQNRSYGSMMVHNCTKGIGRFGPKFRQEQLSDKLTEWGGPKTLFAQIYFLFLPVLIPIYYIGYMNIRRNSYLMRCGRYDSFPALRYTCLITYSPTALFPGICAVLAIGLMTWRLIRQRLYYLMLRHRILIDLERCNLLRKVVFIQSALFALAVVHLTLLVLYGVNQRTGRMYLQNSFDEIFHDPSVLLAAHNTAFQKKVFRVVVDYIGPGIFVILFTCSLGNVEDVLISMSELYEVGPHYVHEYLRGSVLITEGVAAEILHPYEIDDEAGTRSPSVSMEKEDIYGAVAIFLKEAIGFEAVHVIGSPSLFRPHSNSAGALRASCHPYEGQGLYVSDVDKEDALLRIRNTGIMAVDMEVAQPSVSRKLAMGEGRATLLDMMVKTWWPLHLVLKDEPEEFQWYFSIHCLTSFVFIASFVIMRIISFGNHVSLLWEADPISGDPFLIVPFLVVCAVNMLIYLMILIVLGRYMWPFA